jgi:hypothetical protein
MEPIGLRRAVTGLFVPDGCNSVAPSAFSKAADGMWEPVFPLLE